MPRRGVWTYRMPQPGAPGFFAEHVPQDQWHQFAQDAYAERGRLITLWASIDAAGRPVIRAAFLMQQLGLLATMPIEDLKVPYPGIEDLFPSASRMQRAIRDLNGLNSTDPDLRPWLPHQAWPADYRPLTDPAPSAPFAAPHPDSYPFVRVEGDGVHEIAVGPVHAGTIEPGHFRFSVVGEKVLRLEQRLGYAHKGIEQRFTQLPILEGHRLAARVSGDSAVAFSWAYCQALEAMAGCLIPPRAAGLRAVFLELERVANHLGDLGALGNDAGFAFGLSQFSRLKEQLLRAVELAFGERYLMNAVVPGGTRGDVDPNTAYLLRATVRAIADEVWVLRSIYDEHEGVRDRFNSAGAVEPELAARLGLTGLAGRASGQAFDLRSDLPCLPYTDLSVRKCVRSEGDVAARVAVRFDEVQESIRLIGHLLEALPAGPHHEEVSVPSNGVVGFGLIEGWRGPTGVALEAGPAGTIRRCHPHDSSWQNWPVLEHAVLGNIVPDFPLINKSFNLSYSGHDL